MNYLRIGKYVIYIICKIGVVNKCKMIMLYIRRVRKIVCKYGLVGYNSSMLYYFIKFEWLLILFIMFLC